MSAEKSALQSRMSANDRAATPARDQLTHYSSLVNRAVQLRKQQQFVAARICYQRALQQNDSDPQLWSNYGNLLCDMFLFDEAAAAHDKALSLKPDHPGFLYNAGVVPFKNNQPAQAIDIFSRVLELDPSHHNARWNRALCYLQLGDFGRGFREYEMRKDKPGMNRKLSSIPQWQGESLAGKRILVIREQGLGDMIQFVRFTASLKAEGAEVFLETSERLKRFMFCVEGVDHVFDEADIRGRFDYYIHCMSLPHRLGVTLDEVRNSEPYIDSDCFIPPRQLPGNAPLKVGLVWGAKPNHPSQRSCSLDLFAPLLKHKGVNFYSFQKGEAVEDIYTLGFDGLLYDLDDYMTDFYDTAAYMKQMDLMISVDSSPLHCAGALGVDTWGLLLHAPEWRWLMDRDDSPWYPTMTLYRQHRHQDWEGVMERVYQDFESFIRR